jgi:hypothetical protein
MKDDNTQQGIKLSVNQLIGITFLSVGVVTLLAYAVVKNLAKN